MECKTPTQKFKLKMGNIIIYFLRCGIQPGYKRCQVGVMNQIIKCKGTWH